MADREAGGAFAESFTDLMTSLMVIFILLLVATLNNASQKTQDTRTQLIAKLAVALGTLGGDPTHRVSVKPDPADPLGLIVVVPNELLNFKINSPALSVSAKKFLTTFLPRMAGVVCAPQFENAIGSVNVEGHTDPTGTDVLNIGLSQDRANAVAESGLQSLPEGPTRACFERILSVSGRGKAETMGEALSPAEMAHARRVQFKIRVLSSEERAAGAQIQIP